MIAFYRRHVRWILPASLALNLFFTALIGGTLIFHAGGRSHHPPPIRHILRSAGPEARPLIDAALEKREPMLRAAGDAHRAARKAYRAALRNDPFVPEQFSAALRMRDEARRKARSEMEAVLLEVLPQLSPEARKKLAERKWKRRDRRQPPK